MKISPCKYSKEFLSEETETEIINKLGLHARASAKITQLAGSFKSEVWMEKGAIVAFIACSFLDV